ncbi:hypothetical protein EKO04_004023 [Ascochyta lentis]|uniref:N-acetyltransferase domain-containing protein n=1 Tax=Ascochyta lentis TaxID=205686 RepID=A0A8H7J702_9PLEO|nr:hypothetical protein EKO04_004023 [Ascochyta lentis]
MASITASTTVAEPDPVCDTASGVRHDSKRRKLDAPEMIVEVKLRSTSKAARNDPKHREHHIRTPMSPALASFDPMQYERYLNLPIKDKLAARGPTDTDHDHDESEYGSEDDEFADFEWLEQIDGTIIDAGKMVAYCDAKLIRRSKIAFDFYAELEQPSQETSSLAFALFDRYGRLKPHFRDHPVMKGNGVFQDEFNNGDLLLFESIRVDKIHRRKGLASKLVRAIINKVRSKSRGFFAVVAPGWLSAEVDLHVPQPSGRQPDWTEDVRTAYEKALQIVCDQEADISASFFRNLGFRRVGSSSWFAFASDAAHASHTIPSGDDYEWSEAPDSGRLFELYSVSEEKTLHTITDNELLEVVSSFLSGVPTDDPRWCATDHLGSNILHIAAASSKVSTVKWLLEHNPNFRDQNNMKGQTALDQLQAELEESRTQLRYEMMIVHVSDRFRGHPTEAVTCLALLRNITPSATQRLHLKFDCTCSKCLQGFMSPRMQFMLKHAADMQHDMMGSDTFDIGGPEFVEWHAELLRFMPVAVRQNLRTNQSMRQGVANLCGHFAACLRRTGLGADGLSAALPTPTHVLEVMQSAGEWPPCSRNYLGRGGTVSAIGSAMFWSAMQQDEIVGDGSFVDACTDASIEDIGGLRAEFKGLPNCRNDLEYGFVASMLGYETTSSVR